MYRCSPPPPSTLPSPWVTLTPHHPPFSSAGLSSLHANLTEYKISENESPKSCHATRDTTAAHAARPGEGASLSPHCRASVDQCPFHGHWLPSLLASNIITAQKRLLTSQRRHHVSLWCQSPSLPSLSDMKHNHSLTQHNADITHSYLPSCFSVPQFPFTFGQQEQIQPLWGRQ